MKKVYHLGLLGRDIGYSQSPKLFEEIFRREGLLGSTYPVSYTHLTLPTTPYV